MNVTTFSTTEQIEVVLELIVGVNPLEDVAVSVYGD